MRSMFAAVAVCAVAGSAFAVPTATTLPGGWSWQPVSAGTYDTGLVGTARGGTNGQTVGPFTDTSYGIMNEQGTPWYSGTDLSAQQYVQRQVFGNYGTSAPPGPEGARYYNFGYNGTGAGQNFPSASNESRDVTLNHWNNTAPDAGGVATFNQIVRVPVAAHLIVGMGYGADEMMLKFIGGNSGERSQFFVDATINAAFSSSAFGVAANGQMRYNAIVQANDAGGSDYETQWGHGASNDPQVNVWRSDAIDAVFEDGNYVGEPSIGLTPNSLGATINRTYDVLSTLNQSGGTFSVNFASSADLNNLVRDWGNADARVQMGPGMEGNARLVVEWAEFRAVPAPGTLVLLGAGGLLAGRRRR